MTGSQHNAIEPALAPTIDRRLREAPDERATVGEYDALRSDIVGRRRHLNVGETSLPAAREEQAKRRSGVAKPALPGNDAVTDVTEDMLRQFAGAWQPAKPDRPAEFSV